MKRFLVVAILLASMTEVAAHGPTVPAWIGMATGGSVGAGLSGGKRAGLGSGIGFLAGGGLGIALAGRKRIREGRELNHMWAIYPFFGGAALLGAPLGTIIGGGGAKGVALGFVGTIVGWMVGQIVGEGIGLDGPHCSRRGGWGVRQLSVGSLPDGGGYVAARFEFGK